MPKCRQSDTNPSPEIADARLSGDEKFPPFAKGRVSSGFEV